MAAKYDKSTWRGARPEMFDRKKADEALRKYRKDRRPNKVAIAGYTEMMNLGLWEPPAGWQIPIAFDRDGYRINGGSRLRAFLASKLEVIWFSVVRDADPRDYERYDQDIIIRQKAAAHPNHTNAGRDLTRAGGLMALLKGAVRVATPRPLFEYWARGPLRLDLTWADDAIPNNHGAGRTAYAVAFMYAHRADPDFANDVATAWREGRGEMSRELARIREVAVVPKRGGITRESAFVTTCRTLHALAKMHQGDEKRRVFSKDPLCGLRYWSEALNDGVIDQWEQPASETDDSDQNGE